MWGINKKRHILVFLGHFKNLPKQNLNLKFLDCKNKKKKKEKALHAGTAHSNSKISSGRKVGWNLRDRLRALL